MKLEDQYGRKIIKLRISLTDQCNLRCSYCMPIDQNFMKEDLFLSLDEYEDILTELKELGVEEIRLTGGEPLLSSKFKEMCSLVHRLNFKKIGITTNGVLLDRHFEHLISKKIFNLNISLDSLNELNFKKITHSNNFLHVMRNIEAASLRGFQIKLNVVTMKGINDHEIFDFIEFAKKYQLEVRFLELMRIGFACQKQEDLFISTSEIKSKIQERYSLKPVFTNIDSTSQNFVTDHGATIGFISSESQPFCGHCSRWRLTAEGMLKSCLLKNEGITLKNKSKIERMNAYKNSLNLKPYLRPPEVLHDMNTIGG